MSATAQRDRWLALGLLLAVLALAYLVLVHPWWTVPMQAEGERIDGLRERDLRVRTQLAQAPEVQRRLAAARQQLGNRPGFLPDPTIERASASLSQRLEAVVLQASPGNRSCAISNRSPLSDPSRDRYARVTVQVRLRCGTPELASVLHQLESGSPRLFVENVNLLAQPNFSMAGSAPGTLPTGGGLDVSFNLVGYLSPAASANAAREVARAP